MPRLPGARTALARLLALITKLIAALSLTLGRNLAFRKLLATDTAASLRHNFAPQRWQAWLETRRRRVVPALIAALIAALLLLELITLLRTVPTLPPLEQGRLLYNSGRYTEANVQFRQELKERPGNLEARQGLAQSFVALRQWPAAYAYLSEWLQATPNDPNAYFWLGRAQLGENRTAEAEASWSVVLNRVDPPAQAVKPRIQVALGVLRYRQGQYAEASDLLYTALASPNLSEATEQQQAFYLYGLLLARDLRFDDAANSLQRALNGRLPSNQWDNAPARLRLERTAEQARLMLGNLPRAAQERADGAKRARLAYAYIVSEEYSAAEEQLSQVLRVAPGYADARAYLGLVYWRTGRTERANAALTQALAQSPGSRLARQVLTEFIIDRLPALQAQGETSAVYRDEVARANLLLDSLVAQSPEDAALQVMLARYQIARHDYQRAQAHYRQALALNKSRPVAGLNPGAALSRYYSETNFDPCVRGVDTGLEATRDLPNDPESWFAAGLAYSNCGHFAKAAPMLEKALELQPYWPQAVHRLALSYHALGRPAESERLFGLLADLDPERPYHRPG